MNIFIYQNRTIHLKIAIRQYEKGSQPPTCQYELCSYLQTLRTFATAPKVTVIKNSTCIVSFPVHLLGVPTEEGTAIDSTHTHCVALWICQSNLVRSLDYMSALVVLPM